MLEKILLYIDNSESSKKLAGWALKLAKFLNARIYAVFIISQPDSKKPLLKPKASTKSSNQEEAAWAILYEIEDDAFEDNVKISLILEEGRPEERLIEVLNGFELDGIIISNQSKLDFKELLNRCQGKALIIK